MTETPRPPVLTEEQRRLLTECSWREHNTLGEAIETVLAAHDQANTIAGNGHAEIERLVAVVNGQEAALQAARAERDALKTVAYAVCQWTEDPDCDKWDTSCDNAYSFITDGPKENNYQFCPGCGKAVKVSR